jgi:hypothetical protein
VPHGGHGAVQVVGRDLDQDGGAAGAVSLVRRLLIRHALEFASALLDGALDVVVRHVRRLGGVDGGTQAGIAVGVAAALTGRHGDLLDELGKQRAALGVGDRLLSLDLCPLAVAGHTGNPSGQQVPGRVCGSRTADCWCVKYRDVRSPSNAHLALTTVRF